MNWSIEQWLAGEDLINGGFEAQQFHELSNSLSWFRVRSIGDSWSHSQEPRKPVRSMREWLHATRSTGSDFGAVLSFDGTKAQLSLGTAAIGGNAIDRFAAGFQGSKLVNLECAPSITLDRTQASVLRGVPWLGSDGDAALDRLLRVSSPWQLSIIATPASTAELSIERSGTDDLASDLRSRSSAMVRLSENITQEHHDSATAAAIPALDALARRLVDATGEGAWWLQALLTAPNTSALRSAEAAITGVVVGGRRLVRPARFVAADTDGEATWDLWATKELAQLVAPAMIESPGFSVRAWASFDRDPDLLPPTAGGRTILFGTNESGAPLLLDADRLTSHMIIAGMSGAGKTSLLLGLVDQLDSLGIAWTIIEPAKTDLSATFAGKANVVDLGRSGFAFNPFWFPPNGDISGHVERVVSALGAAWGSEEHPLPEILTHATSRAYSARGWDLATSNHPHRSDVSYPCFPTVREVMDSASVLIAESYSGEVRSNLQGAIATRLGALCAGARGSLFDTDRPVDVEAIFASRTILNLDSLGNQSVQSFTAALLLSLLGEVRSGQRSRTLQHVAVIEEAHRLFRRSSDGFARPGSASQLLGDQLSEMRAAGQGIVLLDQGWSRLADDALMNTGVKIIFRMQLPADRTLAQELFNLNEAQTTMLGSLPDHEALLFGPGMDRPQHLHTYHRFPASTNQPIMATHTSTCLPSASSGLENQPIDRMADMMLVLQGQFRAATLHQVEREIQRLLSQRLGCEPAGAVQQNAVRGVVAAACERFGRSHRLSHPTRAALTNALLAGDESVIETLLDGHRRSQPTAACSIICESRSCRFREIALPIAAQRQRSLREVVRTGGHLETAASELIEQARLATRGCGDPHSIATIAGCAALQAFEHELSPLALRVALVAFRPNSKNPVNHE